MGRNYFWRISIGKLGRNIFLCGINVCHPEKHTKHSNNIPTNKEWTGKMIYFNFSSIFGDFFLKFLKKR
jgi:hypothetical protein